MTSWAFYALGRPVGQGNHRTSAAGHTYETTVGHRSWRNAVTAAGFGAGPCLDGPLVVRMIFSVPRPKSARKADTIPCRAPDLSKLARAAEDAIGDAGLWADDARVADYVRLAKVYPGLEWSSEALPVPGVLVAAQEIAPTGLVGTLLPLLQSARADAWGTYRAKGVA